MKKILLNITFIFIAISVLNSKPMNDDLSAFKMEMVTSKILDLFTNSDQDKLREYISVKWLEKEKLDVNAFKINNYYPDFYNILFSTSDVVIAEIGGEEWKHLLIFKFVDEDGKYRIIPKGISQASNDYIEPWWNVREYVCREKDDLIEEKPNFDK